MPLPSFYRQYNIANHGPLSENTFKLVKKPLPQPKANEVLVKIHAVSLQYRDLVVSGSPYYANIKLPENLVPCSDAAGEIVALGSDVKSWVLGQRVSANFTLDHLDGDTTPAIRITALSALLDGVLAEYRTFPAHSLVEIPEYMTYEDASTVPCAAVTAYNALFGPKPLKGGDYVLVLGTGGVSIFALQIAVASGATVIATSSSDEKLSIATKLGAKHAINYNKFNDWEKKIMEFDQEIVVEDTSQTTDLWDPREVINRFLLDKLPEAEIAISSDDDVDRLLSAFKSQSGEFFHYEQFKSALLGLTKGTFYALLKSGVVSLYPIEEFHGLPSLPLCAEACLGDIDQMKEQLTAGVEAHQLDRENKNRTALSYGSEHGHVDVVTLLLTHLYNFDDPKNVALAIFPDSAGRSPLSYAAERGHSKIVVTLINALKSSGVDLNGKDESGRTPLSYAAEAGYVEVVRLLSGNFAESVHLAAANGRTPLSYAQECGHREVVELLKALPATVSPAHAASSPSVSYTSPVTPSQQPLNRMQLDAHMVAPPNQSYTSSASWRPSGGGNYRTQLNNYYGLPNSANHILYPYKQGGDVHKPQWEAVVSVNGTPVAAGYGPNKAEAGENAALRALVQLGAVQH